MFTVDAKDARELTIAFGERGLDLSHFPTRTARHRENSGLEEEIYVLRRYLFTLAASNLLMFPLHLKKGETPDFSGHQAGSAFGIEVTSSTDERDEREMTLSERAGGSRLMGAFGGRYKGGLRYSGEPKGRLEDRDLAADFLRAVKKKSRLEYPPIPIDLLLYATGNAARMASSSTALPILEAAITRRKNYLLNGSAVRSAAMVWDSSAVLIRWTPDRGMSTFSLCDGAFTPFKSSN